MRSTRSTTVSIGMAAVIALLVGVHCSDDSSATIGSSSSGESSTSSSSSSGASSSSSSTSSSSGSSGTDSGADSGKKCSSPAECASGVCTGGVCVDATCSDGVKNGAESDIDCGGTCATACGFNKACTVSADCANNGVCGANNRCRVAQSCMELFNRGTKTDGIYKLDLDGVAASLDGGVGDAGDAGAIGTNVYCDQTTAGGGWTLVGYAAASGLGGKLTVANGTYNPTTRTGSANLAALNLAKKSSDIAVSWSAATSVGNIKSYDHAVSWTIPNASSTTLDPVTVAANCYTDLWTEVDVSVLNGTPSLPSKMFTRTATLGAAYGEAYGLVAPSFTNPSCDWSIDGQAFKALYVGTTATANRKGVVNGNGGSQNLTTPNMGIWLREASCSDGKKNGLETDVDCGGVCGKCAPTKACGTGNDCASGVCTAAVCGAFETSCFGIHAKSPTTRSGDYTVDVDGAGATAAFPVSCDMDTQGGGWTRCGNVNETGLGTGTLVTELDPADPYPTTTPIKNTSFCAKFFGATNASALLIRNRTFDNGADYGNGDVIHVRWGQTRPTLYSYAASAPVQRCENLTTGSLFPNCRYSAHAGDPWQQAAWNFTMNDMLNGYSGNYNNRVSLGPTFKKGNASNGGTYYSLGGATIPQSLAGNFHTTENAAEIYLRDDKCGDGMKNGDETDVDCGGSCGRCAATTACTSDASCESGKCTAGTCAAPYPSCKALLTAVAASPSGVYKIAPVVAATPIPVSVYCDMTTDGGGWTMFHSTSAGFGPTNLSSGDVLPGMPRYMPLAVMQALATASTQIHIRAAGQPGRSATCKADTSAIVNLRQGKVMVPTNGGWVANEWTGPLATNALMQVMGCTPTATYPSIYHACGNSGGLHIVDTVSKWIFNTAVNEPMETYLR